VVVTGGAYRRGGGNTKKGGSTEALTTMGVTKVVQHAWGRCVDWEFE